MPELPGGPSEAAFAAVYRVLSASVGPGDKISRALAAAHDPVLGLDRSVRLGDVVEWLHAAKAWPGNDTHDFAPDEWADAIARKFGGGSDAG